MNLVIVKVIFSLIFTFYLALGITTISDLQDQALKLLRDIETTQRGGSRKCTLANAAVRKDWFAILSLPLE